MQTWDKGLPPDYAEWGKKLLLHLSKYGIFLHMQMEYCKPTKGRIRIHNVFDKLEKQSKMSKVKWNNEKCKVLHLENQIHKLKMMFHFQYCRKNAKHFWVYSNLGTE